MTNVASTAAIPAAVLAHQGGWDEILLVVGPVAIIVALLVVARRRVRRNQPSGRSEPSNTDDVRTH